MTLPFAEPCPLAAAISDMWNEMAVLRERYDAELVSVLDQQGRHITPAERRLYGGGKQIRPLLLFASAVLSDPRQCRALDAKAVRAAVSLEMLHVATLIHDDIVDGAPQRRGMPSVVSERGTRRAVLSGDLQFISAIRTFASTVDTGRDMEMVRAVLDVGFDICTGEMDEQNVDRGAGIEELLNRYRDVIERKTAALFGLACETGSGLAGSHMSVVYLFSQVGRSLGRAFQIMDDLLDVVGTDGDDGKNADTDLRERCLTLPIVVAMSELGESHAFTRTMRGTRPVDFTTAQARAWLARTSAVSRSYGVARSESLAAASLLQHLPDSRLRDRMLNLCVAVVDRSFGDRVLLAG